MNHKHMQKHIRIESKQHEHTDRNKLRCLSSKTALYFLQQKLHQGYRKNHLKISDVYLQRRAISLQKGEAWIQI